MWEEFLKVIKPRLWNRKSIFWRNNYTHVCQNFSTKIPTEFLIFCIHIGPLAPYIMHIQSGYKKKKHSAHAILDAIKRWNIDVTGFDNYLRWIDVNSSTIKIPVYK